MVNVGKYTIHGFYGFGMCVLFFVGFHCGSSVIHSDTLYITQTFEGGTGPIFFLYKCFFNKSFQITMSGSTLSEYRCSVFVPYVEFSKVA